MVFASFIRDADGVRQVKEVLGDKGAHIQIVPKIENQQETTHSLHFFGICLDV